MIPDEVIGQMEAQAASLRWMQSAALQRNDLQLANSYGDRARAFDLAIVVLRHHNGTAGVIPDRRQDHRDRFAQVRPVSA